MTLRTNNLEIEYTTKEVYRSESPFRLSIVSSVSIQSGKILGADDLSSATQSIVLEAMIAEFTAKYPGYKYRLAVRKGVERDVRILTVTPVDSKPSIKDVKLQIVFSFAKEVTDS